MTMAGSVEIRVDVGGSDFIPHTFLKVTHPDGNVDYFGFAPQEPGSPYGPGEVFFEDHEYQFSSGELELTTDQYITLMDSITDSYLNPPTYDLSSSFGSQCATWALDRLVDGGVIPEYLGPQGVPVADTLIFNPYWQGAGFKLYEEISDLLNRALNWILPQDPLALDLDGDGIETLPADGTVLFDHDGDGTKNGTGWIAPDDGILVLDRNGNGLIDNGGELFGDNTIKSDGTRALDGFDALADIDSNGDGIIDTNDGVFSQLRIWRDANSDGISQASELHNLATVNIAGINIAHTVVNNNLGNGNVAFAEGTFIYANGTEGEIGAAASLGLAANNFYREFPDSIPIPESLAHLPDLAGSGAVRDLKEAA